MKFKPLKLAPALIALGVIVFICILRLFQPDFLDRFERITYDVRVRQALRYSAASATNLAFVSIGDSSIAAVQSGALGYRYGLYWPRQVYGRLVQELNEQGARGVAFDVIFAELRPDHPPVQLADDRLVESDEFFAWHLARADNVILAATRDVMPHPLFATNALTLGDISTDKDSDGILRRVKAFRTYRKWHPVFRQAAAEYGIDLQTAEIKPDEIVLRTTEGEEVKVPLDDDGNFDLTDFVGENLPAGMARKAPPFTAERIWHMGIVMAARELNLDLSRADVDLTRGKIVLRGDKSERVLPVDRDGFFYIDWRLPPNAERLTQEPIEILLMQNRLRLEGQTNGLVNTLAGKLVVVGSSATGNDLTDRGATPLERDTLLVSKHWNVANSIITNQFIRRTSLGMDLALIAAIGVVAALLTWHLRILVATGLVVLIVGVYLLLSAFLYVEYRYWIPVVLPVAGALLMTYVSLLGWRVVFEQAEQRHVKAVFSRIVSPDIVQELLQAERLSLGGAQREITVYFADVRGFTAFTDANQERAAAYVSENKLSPAEAEAYYNEQARETLGTINTYLALVADMVKKHDGTLDKYIGDCVMAFWGAPTPNPRHALCCVRAAIDAQRAVYELNCRRHGENQLRELENASRRAAGLPPKPLQPLLLLGSGINTGMATVGLMGSEAHISNYTVFGREVNLASRLESLSGRGRILISQSTYDLLRRDEPALAEKCAALPDANLKGIRSAVKVYEVPWRLPGETPFDAEFTTSVAADRAAATNFIQRDHT